MSVYKIGQRVRVIQQEPLSVTMFGSVVGREGVITRVPATRRTLECDVLLDGGIEWSTFFGFLAPLTDPAADAFMERIRKLEREPVNSPEKVTV